VVRGGLHSGKGNGKKEAQGGGRHHLKGRRRCGAVGGGGLGLRRWPRSGRRWAAGNGPAMAHASAL
jgi:hypothetical protein